MAQADLILRHANSLPRHHHRSAIVQFDNVVQLERYQVQSEQEDDIY
jgi:hypothetical protein